MHIAHIPFVSELFYNLEPKQTTLQIVHDQVAHAP